MTTRFNMKSVIQIFILIVTFMSMVACSEMTPDQGVTEASPTVSENQLLEGLVVADFWASWCLPCREMNPIFKKVSEEMKEKANFLKIDVDNHEELSGKYKIKSIPTILILKEGKVVDKRVGVLSAGELKSVVEKWVGES